jgi:sugar/nucleoside kinase (ribokinase family)/predicted MPP superfamily phosphohydrolase
MSFLNWLHLTDLHCSTSDQNQDWLWPIIEEKFFQDLKKLYKKCGPWDLILFTGDLVYSGKEEEFAKLNEILHRLYKHLNELGSNPILLPIPGNHDLLRPEDTASDTATLLRDNEEFRQKFWNDAKGHYRRVVNKAFENYMLWRDKCKYIPTINPGYIDGDFTMTYEVKDSNFKLGVIGLNTAFFQLTSSDYENCLAINPVQFAKACNSSIIEWKKEHDLCLLMTHHPKEWLTEVARSCLDESITPDFCFIHLFGHMHESNFNSIATGGSQTKIYWQGRSLFGQKIWDNKATEEDKTKKEGRSFGYSSGHLELSGNSCKLRFWPRRAVKRMAGNWELDKDTTFSLNKDEGTPPIRIPLLNPITEPPKPLPTKPLPTPDPRHFISLLEPFDNPNERSEKLREEFADILKQKMEDQLKDHARNHHIIVVGSVCMDAFIETEPKNISHVGKEEIISFPLGSKIIAKKITFFIGGGGANASITFARQGLNTALIGKIGSDTRGYKIINWLHKNKITFFGQVDKQKHGSGYSVILDTQTDEHTILTFKGSNDYLDEPVRWSSWYGSSNQRWLYGASMTGQSFEIQKELFRSARDSQVKTVYNPSSYICETGLPLLEDMLHYTDVLIVNKEGAKHLVGEGQLIYLAEQLAKTGPNTVAVTGDVDGVAIFRANSTEHVIIKPDPALKITETTGAGDAFASGFITGLINEEGNLKVATLMGILNAECVIQTISANQNIPDRTEITKMLNEELEHPHHQINCY